MQKTQLLYTGKAKTVFATDVKDKLIMEFRDDITAFDAQKVAKLNRKGFVNNRFNAFMMEKLAKAGIATHFEGCISETESLVKRLDMVKLECVIRNLAAGSLCRRYGIPEGQELTPPVFEFFLKNDGLHDPLVNESHIKTFRWADEKTVEIMKQRTFHVNEILKPLFQNAGLLLADYKLEFGLYHGELLLGDEVTPDGCRLWDAATRKKLDKDRFRQDLGDVVESYEEVAQRIGVPLGEVPKRS